MEKLDGISDQISDQIQYDEPEQQKGQAMVLTASELNAAEEEYEPIGDDDYS